MSTPRPLLELRAPIPAADAVTLEFDGQAIAARAGEPLSGALLRAGILATTRSPKYRRPRGPYCFRGECGSCQVRIAGQPNLRACAAAAQGGLVVASQNQWGPAGLDPTPLIDQVFRRGIDHHHLVVRPRIANAMMQWVARSMTGFGTLPGPELDAADGRAAEHISHTPEVLIIGAGAAGRRAAAVLEAAGVDVLCVDRRDRPTLGLVAPGPLPGRLLRAGVFAAYPHEGLWAAASDPLERPAVLHTLRPRAVLLALGAREPILPVANNDLPGVVAARGLRLLLARCASRPAQPVVVIGEGAEAEELARDLEATRVSPAEVVEIRGRDQVTGVALKGRRIACGLVALAPTPAPNHELAAQAGARLRFDGHGFAVVTDDAGRVELAATDGDAATPPPWELWACGDLRGWIGPRAAAIDGERVAEALLRGRGRGTPR